MKWCGLQKSEKLLNHLIGSRKTMHTHDYFENASVATKKFSNIDTRSKEHNAESKVVEAYNMLKKQGIVKEDPGTST